MCAKSDNSAILTTTAPTGGLTPVCPFNILASCIALLKYKSIYHLHKTLYQNRHKEIDIMTFEQAYTIISVHA